MDDRLRERLGLAAAGGAHGLAIWLLVEAWPESPAARAAAVSLLTFLAVTALVFHFAWTGRARGRLLAVTLGTGLLYAAVAGWVGASLPGETLASRADEGRAWTWLAASLVTLYVLGPFLQIHQRTGKIHFPYRDLFLHGWNNFFVALVGGLFVNALWAVLLLWAALFELVGIDFFKEFFREPAFVWPVTAAAAGFGIALGRESERVVSTLRKVTLALFRGLLPLVAFVALIFLAALPFTGLDALWSTNHASQLLLTWVALTVLFLNAVYQDGSGEETPSRPVRWLVEAALLAMTAYVVISVHGISLRIEQYGLTPRRFWIVLSAVVLGSYAFGYAFAVVRRGRPWLRAVRAVNLLVALLVVALGLLAHTPLLDPIGWSARSQIARLADGRVAAADFDYGFLHFQLGREGEAGLGELEALADHPEIATIRDGVAKARAAESYWAWQQRHGPAFGEDLFHVLPPGSELPEGLLDAARADSPIAVNGACADARYCAAFAVELDGRAPPEWVLAVIRYNWTQLYVLARRETGFEYLGQLEHGSRPPKPAEIEASLEALEYRAADPVVRDLLIGETRYRLVPR